MRYNSFKDFLLVPLSNEVAYHMIELEFYIRLNLDKVLGEQLPHPYNIWTEKNFKKNVSVID